MKQEWPELDFNSYGDTLETLHQWIQIVGKIRLRTMPWQNHSWHSTLYISPSGFSTHGIPYNGTTFQIDLDFKNHFLNVSCAHAHTLSMKLEPMTVADFYEGLFNMLDKLRIHVEIYARPNEMDPAIPFAENRKNKSYDPEVVNTLWRAFSASNAVFNTFRSSFLGKVSPVHLFWGAFDLAVTRFSGKKAPLHPGGMPNMPLDVMQEAYSHEVSSAGFWPGSKDFPEAIFYSYAYPGNEIFARQSVSPDAAFYSEEMGEFMLKYSDLIRYADPEKSLMEFLTTSYKAACISLEWDRNALEKE